MSFLNRLYTKDVVDVINDNFMAYSKYVILNRALPDVRDGMKPVHRRILYTLHQMKAFDLVKSQDVEGQVMKIHPHGGSYDVIVGMVQPDNNNIPFIVGKGNFGTHTSKKLQASAQRYTEVKMADITKDLFKGLNKDVVKWIPNYNDTMMIPEVLPVKFPAILTTVQEGIAVGMANKMPSFNLKEVCDSVIDYINGKRDIKLIPDFATGGYIIKNDEVFKKINSEGSGTITLRAKANVTKNKINIYEIPYSTTREAVVQKIIELIKAKKIEASNVMDLSDIKGMNIEVTAKRGKSAEELLEELYLTTPLQATYSCNMNILGLDGLPKVMGVNEIIKQWLEFRHTCIINENASNLKKLKEDLEVAKGFLVIADKTKEVVETILNTAEDKIVQELINKYNLTEKQASNIIETKIGKLNKSSILKFRQKVDDINSKIIVCDFLVSDENKRNELIIQELSQVSQCYGKERKTTLIEVDLVSLKRTSIKKEKANDNFKVDVYITKDGFIRKVKAGAAPGKINAGDEDIKVYLNIDNLSEIVVFTNDCVANKIYLDEISECKKDGFGEYLSNILNIKNEKVVGIISNDSSFDCIIIQYTSGKVAKVDIESFKTKTRVKKLKNSLYNNKVVFIESANNKQLIDVKSKRVHKKIKVADITTKKVRNTQGINIINKLEKLEII